MQEINFVFSHIRNNSAYEESWESESNIILEIRIRDLVFVDEVAIRGSSSSTRTKLEIIAEHCE